MVQYGKMIESAMTSSNTSTILEAGKATCGSGAAGGILNANR
jgi:hypothetical protein